MFFLHKKTFNTEKRVYTHRLHTETFTNRLFCTQKLYPEQFLQSIFFFAQMPLRKKNAQQFLQTDGFYTQKIFRTEVLRTESFTHNIFYIQMLLHTDVFTQTQIAHKKLCTQHAFTHSQLLRSSALFPLLDHLPFVFPLSSFGGHRMFFLLSRFVLSGMVIECCGTVFARLVQSVFP